jgi:SIR2-like domain
VAELPNELSSFDARTAPRPGSFNFEGIIHLHGMLDADPSRAGNLILSSRDFARTYLRSGVVANYVYDLVRRYKVVLVGYSADDPTMRYLMDAIGEDAALFDDMHRPYSIAARDPTDLVDPLGDIFVETWRAKNIEPIPYDLRVIDRHGALWETLRQWAEWCRRDIEWVQEQSAVAMALPLANADGFARNFVQDMFSVLDQNEQMKVIRFLNEKSVDLDWIDVAQQVPEKPLSMSGVEIVP